MSSATDFAQLCRLCLVKEQVNVDIFEEPDNIRQIFHKISTCLPVKLSKEDKLPKRICEGCLYKLNIAYQFWNTSVNAEKQLLQWLKQSTRKSEADFPEKVKEEIDVPGNEIENIEDFLETSLTDVNTGKSETCVENVPESSDDEPLAKRRRRLRAQTRAAPPKPAEVIVGKVELNETDGDDNSDDPDDPNYLPDGVDMSDDNEQPGPSGLGTSTSDIPSYITKEEPIIMQLLQDDNEAEGKKKCERSCITKEEPILMQLLRDDNEAEVVDKRQFYCYLCRDKQLYQRHEIIDHYSKQHIGKRLPRLVREPALNLKCDICSKVFNTRQNFKYHTRVHENNYNCGYCPRTYIRALDLVLHLKSHTNVFKCLYCEFQTEILDDVTKHFGDDHKSKPKHTCEQCGKDFDVFEWYKEHENYEKTGKKPFKCDQCEQSFIHSRYLVMHKYSVHKINFTKQHVCLWCNKQCDTVRSLSKHKRKHTMNADNLSICDICGLKLSTPYNLKLHMRTHSGDKPYKCFTCEKCFTKRNLLVEHVRIHTGERPYKCNYCSRGFTQRTSMKIHTRTHTGERPFVCHICKKGFITKALMKTHLNNCKGY